MNFFGSKQQSLQVVELSRRSQTAVQILSKPLAHSSGGQQWARFTVFGAGRRCGPAGWLAQLLIEAGDVDKSRSDNYTQSSLDLRYLP